MRNTAGDISDTGVEPLDPVRVLLGLESLFLMLAFLALARRPSLEQLRYRAPGEWGKLLGLDRIPEVRTVRQKLALLSAQEQANFWSAELRAQWMGEDPDKAAVL